MLKLSNVVWPDEAYNTWTYVDDIAISRCYPEESDYGPVVVGWLKQGSRTTLSTWCRCAISVTKGVAYHW